MHGSCGEVMFLQVSVIPLSGVGVEVGISGTRSFLAGRYLWSQVPPWRGGYVDLSLVPCPFWGVGIQGGRYSRVVGIPWG